MAGIASLSSLNAPSASTLAAAAASSASGGSQTLTQANFIQLLTAQMQNQDPTNPTSPTDYMAQLAQFSTLQGINQLNQNFTSLIAMQSLSQSVGLIGKTVTYTDATGKVQSGAVTSIAMVGGQPQLVVNKTNVSLGQVQTIQSTPKTGAASKTSS
jgi:flagellar basal-body rod modification protein FlgD